MLIRIASVSEESFVDGPGIRYTIFTQGCDHKCPGCHNPSTHSFTAGKDITTGELFKDILKNPLITGVTFSGGDPLYQDRPCSQLAAMLKEAGYNIWVYTGFMWEEVKDYELMKYTDVLVDGPFIEKLRTLELRFRGSSNQRVIDVQESLKQGCVVLRSDV